MAPKNEDVLKNVIKNKGPVSVAIDASGSEFQFYHQGIYKSSSCSSVNLNHAVIAVGYGTYKNEDYFIVRNRFIFGLFVLSILVGVLVGVTKVTSKLQEMPKIGAVLLWMVLSQYFNI